MLLNSKIELRHLAKFVLACQNATETEAARELGVALSTLSASLHTLERELGLDLFRRSGANLYPLPAAFWLYQHATSLLQRERFARLHLAMADQAFDWIRVRVDLTFSMGLVSKALGAAAEDMRQSHPNVLVDFTFGDGSANLEPDTADGLPAVASAAIEIGYVDHKRSSARKAHLYRDDWVVVRAAADALPDGDATPLTVPRLHPALIDAIAAYAARHGIAHQLRFTEDETADLPRLLADAPFTRFAMPRSMLANRLGIARPSIAPLTPALHSHIGASVSGDAKLARAFLERLRHSFGGAERNAVFNPVMTLRQLHYFNLAQRHGGISAAARAAGVAQPSLSSQMRKLEAALAQPLFERSGSGAVSTVAGRRLAPLSRVIEARFRELLKSRSTIAAATFQALSIGLLPSTGLDSAMTEAAAEAFTAFARIHPGCRLKVTEAASAALHDEVRSGALNLAVVSRAQPEIARIHLGPNEVLAVVANPALGLAGRQSIGLDELCDMPLLLAPQHLSMHRAIVTAARERGLRLNVAMEVGSIPLAVAMARRAPFCTILPASAVGRHVATADVTATPLAESVGPRSLMAIFLSERSLSPLERDLVQCLKKAFGARGAAGRLDG